MDKPILTHETLEMYRRYKRLGQLHRPGHSYPTEVYQQTIDWLEAVYSHDKLPPMYDAVVQARNIADALSHQ